MDFILGEYTDDTSMALCLAASLIECSGFDALDQMKRYQKWYREGYMSSRNHCFDIGNTTREAIERFEQTGEPFSGSTDKFSAGNGSIMRLSPVPLFYAENPQMVIQMAAESSRVTHGAEEAVDACRYLSGLILGALQGISKEELLDSLYSPVPGLWTKHPLSEKIHNVASGSFKAKQPPDIKGTGYVVESLEAALWAFYHGSSFEEGLLLAVNRGDDADTTGAVYGQLAGAYYGVVGIPERWLSSLKHYNERTKPEKVFSKWKSIL
ncbi:ADP-ribosylglycohydrolase family protein [Aneurinibacillus tyrosinisolvens]|uniref:ADP-ribosylglycohydrolase family protein n=1 Tax=Aneurinibacillus tyrosinisolvens TaxID=1443435 RepID=UPI0022A8D9DE|nr:ADP-ribosylglycohydrolase family protein [Aneurinibacillus tyrosinisolvens]